MQKRIVRKLDLEMLLSRVKPHPSPRPDLEQYTIPANTAATMLYIAAYMNDDILNKKILDLGCGTGRLALGAAFLGAKDVVGVDIDRIAVNVASENSIQLNLDHKVQWVAGSLDAIRGSFDTVIQNPPYGIQTRQADRKFLEKALEAGHAVYSLHKSMHDDEDFLRKLKASSEGVLPVEPTPFLKSYVEAHGGKVKAVYALVMTVPHMFDFHTRKKHEFVVDLYVLKGR
jgi:putative methylase